MWRGLDPCNQFLRLCWLIRFVSIRKLFKKARTPSRSGEYGLLWIAGVLHLGATHGDK